MSREKLLQQINDEQLKLVRLSHQFEGTKKLFDASALESDHRKMDELRTNLHNLLDMQLDSSSTSLLLARQLMEL